MNRAISKSVLGLAAVAAVVGFVAMNGVSIADDASDSSLEARLRMVEDRLAIEQLLMGDYPKALDSSDWKSYAALFTENGELVQGTTVTTGPGAIEASFSRPRATPQEANATASRPIMKHIVTDLNLHINGDTATDTAYWQTIATRDGQTTIAGAGHYVDVLRKVDGQWKFQRREIVNPARGAAQ